VFTRGRVGAMRYLWTCNWDALCQPRVPYTRRWCVA